MKRNFEMFLYLLERKDVDDYDENLGFLIRARSNKSARQIAFECKHGIECKDIWLNPKKTSCKRVKEEGKHGILLRSFFNG
jgi:hypothetical protein